MLCVADIPGEPAAPHIGVMEHGTAALRWTAPHSDGGSPITNYRLEMRTAGAYRWEPVTADAIRDTSYTVTVRIQRSNVYRPGK